jgi:nicotinate-nucleotide pyrophosphorylase (carboxylating)
MLDDLSLSLVRRALAEDMGGYGDVTSSWTVPDGLRGCAEIVAREELVLSGLPLVEAVMSQVDPGCAFAYLAEEGDLVADRRPVVSLEGSVRGLLGAERTMLNFLSHLSGVATQARRFAQAVQGTGATVVDTRKTTPGLRYWEKRAVRHGGCGNHRYGLFDLVLIKNNHLRAAGGVRRAVLKAQEARAHYLRIEVEVESEADLRAAIEVGADIIMLDNQTPTGLRALVEIARALKPDVILEASGGVTMENVRAIAESGVDIVSTSAITMGAPAANLSLTLLPPDVTRA